MMSDSGAEEQMVIRCRGLPWSATADEIAEFFNHCQLANGNESIHMMTNRDGRPSGEAFIEMASSEDLELAVKKDKQNLGKRYIEVFKAKKSEMDWALKRQGGGVEESNGDNVVRLRGLPYQATKQDVVAFFEGLEITNNGILVTTDSQGRASGEAFVQFAKQSHFDKALEKNKSSMGHRYVEVFRSSMMEARQSQLMGSSPGMRDGQGMMRGRPGPYDRMSAGMGRGYGSRNVKSFSGGASGYYGGGSDAGYGRYGPGGMAASGPPRYVVLMRGLPYRVTENDIAEWFSSVADPIDICLGFANGRPNGEAKCLFASDMDAQRAMTKDRQNMQHRYVELFYDPPQVGAGGFVRPAASFSYGAGGGQASGNYY